MPIVTLDQVRRAAEQLGHYDLEVLATPRGTRWYCTCSCGYRSAGRQTQAAAAQAAAYHLEKAAQAFSAGGYTLDNRPHPDTLDTPSRHAS